MSNTITLPGLIDCHVHFREPGYEHKATMVSEAASARAGGVLTVCEMPNTNPPTVTIAALADKVRRAAEVTDCDIRFFFGVTTAMHLVTLKELWAAENAELARLKERCCGVKLYLDHSTGNQKVEDELLTDIFAACAAQGIPIIAHCEDPEINRLSLAANSSDAIEMHSVVRPVKSEVRAIEHAIEHVRVSGAALHIAHLSTGEGLARVRSAKAEGLPVTCEVAPHHLFLTIDDYASLGTLVKMNPPLRTVEDQKALWDGIADGTVDCIATDHAPHTLEEKQAGAPLSAPSGVPGVETMLPLLLTVAAGDWPHPTSAKPDIPIFRYSDIQTLCFENPNRIFRLNASSEPRITIDPDAEWVVRAEHLHTHCNWTPYEGWKVRGRVIG